MMNETSEIKATETAIQPQSQSQAQVKHTAGPWNFHSSYHSFPGEICRVSGENGFDYLTIQIAVGDKRIAQVEWDNSRNGGHPSVATVEEARANALLILAAPELLKELKEAKRGLEMAIKGIEVPEFREVCAEFLPSIEAVITKATTMPEEVKISLDNDWDF